MSDKHFELTDETTKHYSRTLHRIRATRDLPKHGVTAGDLGGFVETVDNLDGNAWVAGNAKVFQTARVYGNAFIDGLAEVSFGAHVYGHAQVLQNAAVAGENVRIYGTAQISGGSFIGDNAQVCLLYTSDAADE